MVKLPPVRKRSSYSDIRGDDLVFALFYDRVLGNMGAMREDRAFDGIATKTLNTLLIGLKHGKHNQATHGRKGRAGRAGGAAYQAARDSGASHQSALAAGRAATQAERVAIQQERATARTARLTTQAQRARRAAESGQVTPAQRAQLLAKADRLEARARGEKVGPMQKPATAAVAPPSPPAKPKRAPRKPKADKPSEEAYAKARAYEDKIRPQRFESALVLDGNGRVIIDKDGGYSSVDFSRGEVAKIRMSRNVVMTHNHPLGWEVDASDPRRAGNSFSGADVQFAANAGVYEMRAVTPTGRYYVRRPPGGWDQSTWDNEIAPRYNRINRETRADFTRRIRERSMTPEQAEARHQNTVWSQVFGELGYDYGYEEG